jgi:hypothetical protein
MQTEVHNCDVFRLGGWRLCTLCAHPRHMAAEWLLLGWCRACIRLNASCSHIAGTSSPFTPITHLAGPVHYTMPPYRSPHDLTSASFAPLISLASLTSSNTCRCAQSGAMSVSAPEASALVALLQWFVVLQQSGRCSCPAQQWWWFRTARLSQGR